MDESTRTSFKSISSIRWKKKLGYVKIKIKTITLKGETNMRTTFHLK